MVTREMHLGKETTLLEQNFVMVLLIFCLWWLDDPRAEPISHLVSLTWMFIDTHANFLPTLVP